MSLVFSGALFGVSGCTKAGMQSSLVFEKGRDQVHLAWLTDSKGGVVSQSHDHPAGISKEKLTSILAALRFSEKIFLKWEPKGRLFDKDEVRRIAKPIAQALAQADANQWVAFQVSSYKRAIFFKSRRLTTGWICVRGSKLHLVLGNFMHEINREPGERDDLYEGDPRLHFFIESYRIDSGPYNTPPAVDPEIKWLRKEHWNWTVVDLVTFKPPAGEEDDSGERRPALSVEERLEILEGLYKKDLVTKEEYEAKRRDILDSL